MGVYARPAKSPTKRGAAAPIAALVASGAVGNAVHLPTLTGGCGRCRRRPPLFLLGGAWGRWGAKEILWQESTVTGVGWEIQWAAPYPWMLFGKAAALELGADGGPGRGKAAEPALGSGGGVRLAAGWRTAAVFPRREASSAVVRRGTLLGIIPCYLPHLLPRPTSYQDATPLRLFMTVQAVVVKIGIGLGTGDDARVSTPLVTPRRFSSLPLSITVRAASPRGETHTAAAVGTACLFPQWQ